MTPSMEAAHPYYNSWVGGVGDNDGSDNGNNATPQQRLWGDGSSREQQGQDNNFRTVIAPSSAVATGSMTAAGKPGFGLGFACNSNKSSNNDVPPMAGFDYRDEMMVMMMKQRQHRQMQQQQQQQPRRPQQQQQQQVTVLASGHGDCRKRSSCDDMFLQSMPHHQQQQQEHYGSAAAAIMGYHASPSMMGGKSGPAGNLQNQHQQLEEPSSLNNADIDLVERRLSSDGAGKGESGSTDPSIAAVRGGSSFATMNNMPPNGGDGFCQGTRDAAGGKRAFIGAPGGFTSPNFHIESMSSSLLFGRRQSFAKEYNPKQIPSVVPVGRGWNDNELAMMHDKPQPIVVDAALASTELSAAALLTSSLPRSSSSRDDNLVLSPKDSTTEPIAAAAAAAAESTAIAEMDTMTTATIACQTSPNMKVLSRETNVVDAKSQVADPSKEKVSFIAKSRLADPSRETNVSTAKSQARVAAVADPTSTDYLRSIIPRRLKKRKKLTYCSNHNTENADRCAPIKEISIPSNFSPGHSYRAAAAYSLLRTLSNELRLSPFTLQAFTSALMLPIPSKLLGEVHVRVLRVLFASAAAAHRNGGGGGSNGNMGGYYYENFGDGGIVDLIARRRRSKRNHYSDNETTGGGGRKENSESLETTKVEEKEEVEYEFVRKRAGNNLFFLDLCTWPLFYQDYALMSTEGQYLEVMGTTQDGGGNDGGDDEEEFISIKSVAMTPLNGIDLHPKVIPKFIDEDRVSSGADNISGTYVSLEWADRCPAGPLGRRNQHGRFVCCPFHISAAVQLFRKIHRQPASVAASSAARGTNASRPSTLATSTKNHGRNSKKEDKKMGGGQGSSGRKKTSSRKSLLNWKGNGNDSSDDYPSPTKKKSKRNGVDGIAQQHNKSQQPMIPIRSINLDARHHHHLPSSSSSPISGIRGVRVLDVEMAKPSPDKTRVFVGRDDRSIIPSWCKNMGLIEGDLSGTSNTPTGLNQKQSNVLDPPNPIFVDLTRPIIASTSKSHLQSQIAMISPASQVSQPVISIENHLAQFHGINRTGTATRTEAVALPRNPPQNLHEKKPPFVQHPQAAAPSATTHARPSFTSIVIPPVRLRSVNSNPLVVSDEIAESVEKFFMSGHATSNKGENSEKKMDTDCIASDRSIQGRITESLDNDQLLAHMVPVQQLERGIPYHHLSLDAKLTMLEFILDELLQVPEISDEMTRRQTLTSDFASPYGVPPLPHEYEQICNADECTVCGFEGDLLCCDGCPGSFHRACIGMFVTGKLPEGKWLCPECKIVDASKMVSGEKEDSIHATQHILYYLPNSTHYACLRTLSCTGAPWI